MQTSPQLPSGRYGKPATPARKRALIIAFVLLGILGTAVALWAGIGMARAPVWTQEVGYRVHSSEHIDVTFDLTKDQDATAVCSIQALNRSFAEVGVAEITVGPLDQRSSRHTVNVSTSELATTGVVKECNVLAE